VPIQDDHFSLFGLPARFVADERALEESYKRVQARIPYPSGSFCRGACG